MGAQKRGSRNKLSKRTHSNHKMFQATVGHQK